MCDKFSSFHVNRLYLYRYIASIAKIVIWQTPPNKLFTMQQSADAAYRLLPGAANGLSIGSGSPKSGVPSAFQLKG
jgi:hypothetical protein